jgi:HEAT repeat protein
MNEQNNVGETIDSLVNLLESPDDKVRRDARTSLVAMRKQAVSPLSSVLENSKVYKARWEAAKALGAIGDAKAIPSLIKALDDPESDVAWLAAEALEKFKKAAWPELMHALVKRGSDSVLLRHGAHHILRQQKAAGFNFLLDELRKALESDTVPENIPIAAYHILEKMKKRSGKERKNTNQ